MMPEKTLIKMKEKYRLISQNKTEKHGESSDFSIFCNLFFGHHVGLKFRKKSRNCNTFPFFNSLEILFSCKKTLRKEQNKSLSFLAKILFALIDGYWQ
jgi:hypothetical protein